MNWIKVTNETTLSKGSKILIYTKSEGVKSVTVHSDTGSPLIVSDTGELHFDIPYTLDEYTHYCKIAPPKPYNISDLVKDRLEDSKYELDKWDGRKDITYNDTSYNAASVNYGKIESLQYVLDLLKR